MKRRSRSRSATGNETAKNFDPGNTTEVCGSSNKREHVNRKNHPKNYLKTPIAEIVIGTHLSRTKRGLQGKWFGGVAAAKSSSNSSRGKSLRERASEREELYIQ